MNEGTRAAELYTLLVFTKMSGGLQYMLALTSDQHLNSCTEIKQVCLTFHKFGLLQS